MTTRRSNWQSFAGALLASAGLLVVVFSAAFWLVVNADGLVSGWTNPGHYELVRRESLSAHELRSPRSERGDFNGDGVADKLDVVSLRREFLTDGPTNGMVYVRSGVDGAVLLAHPIPNPLFPVFWCGDSDGDAADEVFVDVPPSERFAFQRDAVR